jgi:hypothetical protein
MRQASPVHFVAGLFQSISPNAQRMWRQTERCGMLGVPHAAACPRTPEEPPDRCPSARFGDCAEASWACWTARSSAAVLAFSGAISANLLRACADIPRPAERAIAQNSAISGHLYFIK